jgi:2-polyprenyl-3-methyl-5-hydroxy-6-metoxy-1,4-benzoquinol methylase
VSPWNPTPEYQRVAEANRQFYRRIAPLYDATETCVTDAAAQRLLESDLDRVLAALGGPRPTLRALDACGGSGNVALKLLRRGVDVTLADISAELLEIFRLKCARAGFTAHAVQTEIGAYLMANHAKFDLIVFSSALHHLQDIGQVLLQALGSLKPGGLVFTTLDPTPRNALRPATRLLLRLEYYLFKLFKQTPDLAHALARRIRRTAAATSSDKCSLKLNPDTAGVLAEYHVEKGIDDFALAAWLREAGFDVVWHERTVECRSLWARHIVSQLKDHTNFKLLLQKPKA